MEIQDLNTVLETATILRLNQATIYSWINAEKVPAIKLGRRVFITRKTIEKLMTEGLDTRGLRNHAS